MKGNRKPLTVQKEGECIVPTSLLCTNFGYRRYWDGTHMVYYHKYVWEMVYGAVPKGYDLHHTCHNKGCCNLEHIQLLSRFEHMHIHKTGNTNNLGKHFNKPFKLSKEKMEEAKSYWLVSNCSQYVLASKYGIGQTTAHRYIVRWKSKC